VPEKGFHDPVRVCNLCIHVGGDRRSNLTAAVGSSPSGSLSGNVLTSIFADDATIQQRASQAAAMESLKTIYKGKIKPLEDAFKFGKFYQSEVSDGDFDAKVSLKERSSY
jgi:hypothetical protein